MEVFLPKNISQKEIYSDRSRVVGIDYLQLLEPPPIQLQNLSWDEDDLARQAELRRQYLARERRIEEWFNIISSDVEKKKKINFSDYYFKIMYKDNDFEQAIKEATLVLKEFTKHPDYEVTVSEEFNLDPKHPHIGIWKMQIKSTAS
jgi:hypothetical protein